MKTSVNRLFQRRWLYSIAAVLAWLPAALSWAAPRVEFDIQPRALNVGEVAVCSITIRGMENPPQPGLPPVEGWQISMAGAERSFSYGSGGSDSAITFRFRMVPLKTGSFTFGPFQYALGSVTAELPPIEVRVVAPGGQARQDASPADVLLASLASSETNLYSQQVFDITLTVYAAQGVNVGRDIALLNMPSSGISLQPFQELGSSREVVNNTMYEVRRFRAKATALTAGSFRFEPTVRLSLLVPRQSRQRDPFFDGFGMFEEFFGRHESRPVDITPNPLDLVVQSLPLEDQPPGFSGAVGHFALHAQVKPSEVTAGDPVTVNIAIVGEGNIESVAAPEFTAGNDFRVYEAKQMSRDIDASRASGRKVFEQVLIPRSAEITHIPEIAFSFFDPAAGVYRVAKQGPFPLKVSPATGVVAHVVQAQTAPGEPQTRILGTDILYLKPAPARWRNGGPGAWVRSGTFLVVQLFPPVALGLLFLFVRRQTDLARDVAKARRQKAPRAAREGIRRAEQALAEGHAGTFFEALSEALSSYFGNRLNLSPGEISADIVLNALRRGGMDEPDCSRLEKLFQRCEEARFAGTVAEGKTARDDADDHREYIRQVHELLKQCEKIRV